MPTRPPETTLEEPTASINAPADSTQAPNVHPWERAGSVVLGAALVAMGLGRRSRRGAAFTLAGGALLVRGLTGNSPLYRGLGVSTATGGDRRTARRATDGPTIARTITVGRPAEALSELLRDPETLGRIAGPRIEVTPVGEARHRWTLEGPLDRRSSWETRLVEDRDGKRLRREAVDDGAPFREWTATFRSAPRDRGTEVTFRVRLNPPGGSFGRVATQYFEAVPEAVVGAALDRFKSLAETGEVPTSETTPSGRGRGDLV